MFVVVGEREYQWGEVLRNAVCVLGGVGDEYLGDAVNLRSGLGGSTAIFPATST